MILLLKFAVCRFGAVQLVQVSMGNTCIVWLSQYRRYIVAFNAIYLGKSLKLEIMAKTVLGTSFGIGGLPRRHLASVSVTAASRIASMLLYSALCKSRVAQKVEDPNT
jgi:hypothetical protein